jgi:SsrA-binding protein
MDIKNRSAFHEYLIEDRLVAGMVLTGTEVKSIRDGKVSFADTYCFFDQGELWLKGLHISEYRMGTSNNHDAVRNRKLLLTKRELRKWDTKVKEKGYSIIPLRIFFNENNLAKIEIGLAKGKKLVDKREHLKKQDTDRTIRRYMK